MTTPLLTNRDALAKALRLAIEPESARRQPPPERASAYCLALADALLASGVVRDPATLADDEALERAVITAGHQIRWEDRPGDIPLQDGVRHTLRALAAALTEDPS